MTTLRGRVAVLFVLAALLPVALTALVWFVAEGAGRQESRTEADLAAHYLDALSEQRKATVAALCQDDLIVDRLLAERALGSEAGLDYDRLFGATMRSAGLQALWILDAASGSVLANGHRNDVLGSDGSTLLAEARAADDQDFLVVLGSHEHQRFVARGCRIARGGVEVLVVGAHRVDALRGLDPRRVAVRAEARRGEIPIAELRGADRATRNVVVWRPSPGDGPPPLLLWIGCVALVALGLALVFGNHLSRWLESSVEELTTAATRIGAGDFATTLREGQTGAFRATATAFNRMTRDLRDAQDQLRQTERIAAWQDIAKRLAHELKNPLSPIRLSIETLRKAHARSHDEFDALFDESTKTILQEVERLRHIVDEFSRFARLPSPTLSENDLREVVPQAVALYAAGAVAVSAELPGHPVVARIDADQITQVLHNLLQNGCDAAHAAHPEHGGTVRVTLEDALDVVRIRVTDNGVGIPDDMRNQVFEPYFTDKEGGTGLGLAIASRIIAEHRGTIQVDSVPGQTTFTVTLPRVAQ
ncbi:MAG: ATP-binding protein [Polyangiales bacterium]